LIAADTSTWVAFLQGDPGEDTELLDQALAAKHVLMAPAVLTELLSDPKLSPEVGKTLAQLPLIDITRGFWERAGKLRARVLARHRKARLGDALIAQCCVDRKVTLLTRDGDFRAFAEAAELALFPHPEAGDAADQS
jgi:predicted nucleic acid-binding protein